MQQQMSHTMNTHSKASLQVTGSRDDFSDLSFSDQQYVYAQHIINRHEEGPTTSPLAEEYSKDYDRRIVVECIYRS